MKKKKVIPNSTQQLEKEPSKPFDEYYDLFTLRTKPVSDVFIEQIAQKLMHWAINNEEAYKISQFYEQEGLHNEDIDRWCKRSKAMAYAKYAALRAIGNRREIGGLKKKLDSGMVSYTMAHYDKDWKDLAEWRNTLKLDADQKGETKIVVLEKYPDSKIVPAKPQEDPETVAGRARKKTMNNRENSLTSRT